MNNAILKFEKEFNMLSFKYKDLNLSFGISPVIDVISEITEVDMGYIVIQTNKGEEYIDLLGMLELDKREKCFILKVESLLKEVTLKNLELRC